MPMLIWSSYLWCAIRRVQLIQRQATITPGNCSLFSPFHLLSSSSPDELPHFQAATHLHSVPDNSPTPGRFIWMQLYPMHVVSCDRLMRTWVRGWRTVKGICYNLFTHLSVYGHFGCFAHLAALSNAVVIPLLTDKTSSTLPWLSGIYTGVALLCE